MLFKHFASKNQLSGFDINGRLAENGFHIMIKIKFNKRKDLQKKTFA